MKKAILIILLSIQFYSCQKILDTTPTDFSSPGISFENAQQLDRALVAVYDALYTHYGTSWLYRYGIEADEALYRGKELTGIHMNSFNASEPMVRSIYSGLFLGINRANLLLENVDNNPSIDLQVRNRVKGEALFLRAQYYFMMVQMFGGVPLVLETEKSPEQVHVPRASVKEVYDQVVKDMITAESLVSDIQSLGFGGRVNKSAVRAYLVRIYLHMAGTQLKDQTKYAEAVKWALKIMDEGYHSLNPSYSAVFINYSSDKYDPKESLFEVECWGNRTGGYVETSQNGAVNGPPSANSATGVAVGGLYGNLFLNNLYKDGDLRKGWNIANFTYNATGPNGAKTFVSQSLQAYNRAAGKFRREYEVVTPKAAQWTPQNIPLMRYSDVLLMFAEASNELNGPTPQAIEAVNKVRRRAWAIGGIKSFTLTNLGSGYTSAPVVKINGDSTLAFSTIDAKTGMITGIMLANNDVTGLKRGFFTSAPTVTITGGGGLGGAATVELFTAEDADLTADQTANKELFREAIQNERAQELCYEGLRKFDLIRWGIYVTRMHEVGDEILNNMTPAGDATFFSTKYKNVEGKHILFPIPELELIRNNKLVQTPGWE